MHRATISATAIVLAGFLWANSRVSWLAREFDVGPPEDYGRVAQYSFMRGWPLSPWMLCPIHGMKLHPEETFVWLALMIDAAIALVMMLLVAASVECVSRGLKRRRAADH